MLLVETALLTVISVIGLSLCGISIICFVLIPLSARAVIPVSVIYSDAMHHSGDSAVSRVTPALPLAFNLIMTVKTFN